MSIIEMKWGNSYAVEYQEKKAKVIRISRVSALLSCSFETPGKLARNPVDLYDPPANVSLKLIYRATQNHIISLRKDGMIFLSGY